MTSLPKNRKNLLKSATALAAVGAGSADAALVQITLTGNQLGISSNSLNQDLTGDTMPDLMITGVNQINSPALPPMTTMIPMSNLITTSSSTTAYGAMFPIGFITTTTFFTNVIPGNPGAYGVQAQFDANAGSAVRNVSSNGAPAGNNSMAPGGTATGGITLSFTDASILGGASTSGFLEIVADGAGGTLTLTRLVFDDGQGAPGTPDAASVIGNSFSEFTAVPEPSSLALLALGAGGLAFRRNRKKIA